MISRKTKGASPAFIKELMRRAAQFQFDMKADGTLEQAAVDGTEEMVFDGGTLNLKLLGGSGELEHADRLDSGELVARLSPRIPPGA